MRNGALKDIYKSRVENQNDLGDNEKKQGMEGTNKT